MFDALRRAVCLTVLPGSSVLPVMNDVQRKGIRHSVWKRLQAWGYGFWVPSCLGDAFAASVL